MAQNTSTEVSCGQTQTLHDSVVYKQISSFSIFQVPVFTKPPSYKFTHNLYLKSHIPDALMAEVPLLEKVIHAPFRPESGSGTETCCTNTVTGDWHRNGGLVCTLGRAASIKLNAEPRS